MIVRTGLHILFLFILFVGCSQQDPTQTQPPSNTEVPTQELWDAQIRSTDKGKLKAVINFGHMERYSNKSLILFDQGIDIDFYNEAGEKSSKLTADGGEMDENTEDVKAYGNVVVVSDSGFTLHTDELYYYKKPDKIVSNVKVKVTTTEGDTLHGVGFESDSQMDYWEIREPHDGVAHKGVDLSLDRFEKTDAKDSVATDSTIAVDSTATDSTVSADSTAVK